MHTTNPDAQSTRIDDLPTGPTPTPRGVSIVSAAAVGAAVMIALGTYGRVHSPTGQGVVSFGFPAVLPMKAWLTTGAAALGVLQLVSALWMWERIPFAGTAPVSTAAVHRWLGTVAFFLTLPVAYHCLWSLGFQDSSARVVVHSLLGCAFYGAFTTKMLVLHSERVGNRALPVMGGALLSILSLLWMTSSLWFFTEIGFPGV